MYIDTKVITAEYRLSHWAKIIKEHKESGLSTKDFCEKAGFHENTYYYWKRKIREAACEQLLQRQNNPTGLKSQGFTEVKLYEESVHITPVDETSHIRIEASGFQIIIGETYPVEKLAKLFREMIRPC